MQTFNPYFRTNTFFRVNHLLDFDCKYLRFFFLLTCQLNCLCNVNRVRCVLSIVAYTCARVWASACSTHVSFLFVFCWDFIYGSPFAINLLDLSTATAYGAHLTPLLHIIIIIIMNAHGDRLCIYTLACAVHADAAVSLCRDAENDTSDVANGHMICTQQQNNISTIIRFMHFHV